MPYWRASCRRCSDRRRFNGTIQMALAHHHKGGAKQDENNNRVGDEDVAEIIVEEVTHGRPPARLEACWSISAILCPVCDIE
jgi:hypothetical protein